MFSISFLLSALALSGLLANAAVLQKRASGVQTDPSTANGQTFDYIVVGAGLGGLTVANRLSENSGTTVLLVEVGNDDRTDPRISNVYNYGQAFGTSLAYSWPTDQGRSIIGGRTLGGSTSINGAAWTRASAAQYDALSELLDPEDASLNWNFDSLFTYMKKAEGYSAPNDQQRQKGADSVDSYHGTTGPVQATFPDAMFGGPQQPAFVTSVTNITGITHCKDLNGGNVPCVAYTPNTINWHQGDARSSAATAYLSPVQNSRSNWLTLVGQTVTKILTTGSAPNVTATGVQFKSSKNTGSTYTAHARKEVIVSAGAIRTPQLLQLSGIGDPTILNSLNIPVVVNLTTVGRNLIEQTKNSMGHSGKFNAGGSGPSDCIAFPSLAQLFTVAGGSNGTSAGSLEAMVAHITNSYPSWAQKMADHALSADTLTTIFGIQADLIVNKSVPVTELFFDTGYPAAIGIDMWQLLPFSRGSVKITSSDAFQNPNVVVNYFAIDYDLSIQTATARLSRRVLNGKSFNSISTGETIPGTKTVPDNGDGGSDPQWQKWILAPEGTGFDAVWHPIGTAAMMRRSLGGVVDARLRIYDTANIRVVDASVLPLQVSAHLSSTLYGVAEKAADIIKSGA